MPDTTSQHAPSRLAVSLSDFVRKAILSKQCLVFSCAFSIFIGMTDPGALLDGLPTSARIAINLMHLGIFLGYSYAFLPRAMIWALENHRPAAVVQALLYLPLCTLLAVEMAALTSRTPNAASILWTLLVMLPIVTVACVVGMLYFQSSLLPKSRLPITPNQLWAFSKSTVDNTLQSLLDPSVRGRVIRLEAEKQYVKVTTETGQQILRLPLTHSVDLVSD